MTTKQMNYREWIEHYIPKLEKDAMPHRVEELNNWTLYCASKSFCREVEDLKDVLWSVVERDGRKYIVNDPDAEDRLYYTFTFHPYKDTEKIEIELVL